MLEQEKKCKKVQASHLYEYTEPEQKITHHGLIS